MLGKRSHFVQKASSRLPGPAEVFIWENFHPGFRDLGRKNRDLGQRASPASLINTSKFLQRKEWRGEIPETKPARLTGLI